MQFHEALKGILPYKMSAVGDFFLRFQSGTKDDFTLQNERRRRKFCDSRAVLRTILPYNMSAAGDFLQFQSGTEGGFTLQNVTHFRQVPRQVPEI